MISQESLKQLALNLGYLNLPTAPFRTATHKILVASVNNSTGFALVLLHSQNRSSPPAPSWERKLGWGCRWTAPSLAGAPHTTRLPAALAGWEAAAWVLAYFHSWRQLLGREETENQGALARSLHPWQRSRVRLHPEQLVWAMQGSKGGSRGCSLPWRSTETTCFLPTAWARVSCQTQAASTPLNHVAEQPDGKDSMGFIKPHGVWVWKVLQTNEYWTRNPEPFQKFLMVTAVSVCVTHLVFGKD